MPQLRVDFTALAGMQSAIRRASDEIETSLTELDNQIRWLTEVWQGSSAAGFVRSAAQWRAGSADLRTQLVFLHDLVGTAANNHADAVAANTRMWQV